MVQIDEDVRTAFIKKVNIIKCKKKFVLYKIGFIYTDSSFKTYFILA